MQVLVRSAAASPAAHPGCAVLVLEQRPEPDPELPSSRGRCWRVMWELHAGDVDSSPHSPARKPQTDPGRDASVPE